MFLIYLTTLTLRHSFVSYVGEAFLICCNFPRTAVVEWTVVPRTVVKCSERTVMAFVGIARVSSAVIGGIKGYSVLECSS